MPVYEYTCRKCDAKFEKLVPTMSESKSPPCPECGSKQTEKALSVFAVGAEQSHSARPAPCAGCSGEGPCPLE